MRRRESPRLWCRGGETGSATDRRADSVEVADALAYALRYDGKRRVHHADDAMARITAERLIRHLEQAGFVLMRKAPGAASTTSHMPSSIG